VNRIACAEEVLTDEKGEDINKMRVERDFLERQVINWQGVSSMFSKQVSKRGDLTVSAIGNLLERLK
jgi:hypothetical protein